MPFDRIYKADAAGAWELSREQDIDHTVEAG
jgi:hypothetical protein